MSVFILHAFRLADVTALDFTGLSLLSPQLSLAESKFLERSARPYKSQYWSPRTVNSLSKTIDAEVQGEMATLKETVNSMVMRLRIFSAEVTRVAKEVGTDGQLGGQAVVRDVEGTWKELVSFPKTLLSRQNPDWFVGSLSWTRPNLSIKWRRTWLYKCEKLHQWRKLLRMEIWRKRLISELKERSVNSKLL